MYRRNSFDGSLDDSHSQNLMDRLEQRSTTFNANHVTNIHYYNSARDQDNLRNGTARYSQGNSAIVRTQSPRGTVREYHTHNGGRYYSGYEQH